MAIKNEKADRSPRKRLRTARSPKAPAIPTIVPAEPMAMILDRCLGAGPEFLERDLIAIRHQFLAARVSRGASAFEAFQALSLCVAAALHSRPENSGSPASFDYATNAPSEVIQIPLWAAFDIFFGWCSATLPVDDGVLKKGRLVPFDEAFGLAGKDGGRTIARHHLNFHRDFELAVNVSSKMSRNPSLTKTRAAAILALERNLDAKMIERAYERLGEYADRAVEEQNLVTDKVTTKTS